MPKANRNHQHRRDEPAKNTTAPNSAGDQEAPGRSGQGLQDQDPKRRIGQHENAGEPPLMKK